MGSDFITSGEWLFAAVGFAGMAVFFAVYSGFVVWIKYVNKEHSRRKK